MIGYARIYYNGKRVKIYDSDVDEGPETQASCKWLTANIPRF